MFTVKINILNSTKNRRQKKKIVFHLAWLCDCCFYSSLLPHFKHNLLVFLPTYFVVLRFLIRCFSILHKKQEINKKTFRSEFLWYSLLSMTQVSAVQMLYLDKFVIQTFHLIGRSYEIFRETCIVLLKAHWFEFISYSCKLLIVESFFFLYSLQSLTAYNGN